jgi:anti-sigma factor RsiW
MIGDRELMRFHDGELSASEASLVEKELEQNPSARAKLRGLSQTGELVRQWADERSAGFDVADQIMARLDTPARTHSRSRVIELWLPAAAAVALAAAVLLMVFGRTAPVTRPAPAALSQPAPKTAAVLPAALEPSVAIESVDFGEKPGTIFMVGGESGETPVIWLSESQNG